MLFSFYRNLEPRPCSTATESALNEQLMGLKKCLESWINNINDSIKSKLKFVRFLKKISNIELFYFV